MARIVGSEMGYNGKTITVSNRKQRIIDSSQPGVILKNAREFPSFVRDAIEQGMGIIDINQ